MSLLTGPRRLNVPETRSGLSLGELFRRREAPIDAGIPVEGESAARHAAVFACRDLIGRLVSTLPVHEYDRLGGAQRELPTPPVLVKPDGELDVSAWLYQALDAALTRGNAYGLIQQYDARGWPTQIVSVHPDSVGWSRKGSYGPVSWTLEGKPVGKWPAGDLWHLPAYTLAGCPVGVAPITYAALTIGIGLAAQQFGSRWFRDGMVPAALLTNEAEVPPDLADLVKEMWRNALSGNREPVVLGDGWDYKPVSINPEESQFLDCVVPSTLFTMADGTTKPGRDLRVGDRVLSWDEADRRLVPAQVVHLEDKPAEPVYRVVTERGRSLTTNGRHPYLAKPVEVRAHHNKRQAEQWVSADKLKVGDYVAVALDADTDETPMDPDEAYLLGALVGDGGMSAPTVKFTTEDADILARVRAAVEAQGCVMSPRGRNGKSTDYAISYPGRKVQGRRGVYSVPIKRWLDGLGLLGCTAPGKFIPPAVFAGGRKTWLHFLAGLVDTDGGVAHPGASHPYVRIDTVSRRLADDTQHLLALLGLQARVYTCEPRQITGCATGTTSARRYTVQVSGHRQIRLLNAELQLEHARKRANLAAWASTVPRSEYEPDRYTYDRVVSVERLDPEEVLGVEVEGTHTHVTAGLITHNTIQANKADVAMFFGVDPEAIGATRAGGSSVVYQNLGMANTHLMVRTINAWIVRLERALTDLRPRPRYVKLNPSALLRVDPKTQAEINDLELANGTRNQDEVRELHELAPIPGGKGKRHNWPPKRVQLSDSELHDQVDTDRNKEVLELVTAIQKVYLGVGVVLTDEEAREIVNRMGAGLAPGPLPEPEPDPLVEGDSDPVAVGTNGQTGDI